MPPSLHIANTTQAYLYLQEYPRLVRQLGRLITLAQREDPNVAALILFGSTARLFGRLEGPGPSPSSGTDVMALLHDPAEPRCYLRHLHGAMAVPEDPTAWCTWTITSVVTTLEASDLDQDFLQNISSYGVLLCCQAGVTLPPVLARLLPYHRWVTEVNRLLYVCLHRVLDSRVVPDGAPVLEQVRRTGFTLRRGRRLRPWVLASLGRCGIGQCDGELRLAWDGRQEIQVWAPEASVGTPRRFQV